MDAIVVTGDKDLLQLVNANTRVMMLSGSGRDTRMLDEEAKKKSLTTKSVG